MQDNNNAGKTPDDASPSSPQAQDAARNPDKLRDVLRRLQAKFETGGASANQQPKTHQKAQEAQVDAGAEASANPDDDATSTPSTAESAASSVKSIAIGQTADAPKANDEGNKGSENDENSPTSDESDQTEPGNLKVDRATRHALRRVQTHLIDAQVSFGAQHETIELMEAIYHPHNPMSSMNYVTPRRKTAWVSTLQVSQGINYLRERERKPRVLYIEGLLPPLFARSLRQLNLHVEHETPLMVYLREGLHGSTPPAPSPPHLPYNLRMETVSDIRGAEVWWYVWQNAYYDVLTLGVEPLFVGREIEAVYAGRQIDIILYRENFPFGVARVTLQNNSAHIVSTAIFHELRTPEVLQWLYAAAVNVAGGRGCDLVFAPGSDEEERAAARALGFMDFGSIVCYAANQIGTADTQPNDTKPLVQPIFNLR